METKPVTLGSSLLVPCVQELAKQGLTNVPPRYVRPSSKQDQPHLCVEELPVIDMRRLLCEDSMDSELPRLHSACKDWGFFQLVNHGVSSSLLEKIKMGIRDFFNLPMEEKKKFWQSPGDLEGFGQAFVVSEEQKLDWADMFYMGTLPVQRRKPHLFPKLPLPFRDDLELYASELRSLAMAILAQMAKALDIEAEEMKNLFENGFQSMRMNYYPPCPQPEKVIGLTPHSDPVGLTILLQITDVEGLQIRKEGKWVPVKPLPDAFIVNIGDVSEIITNGTYRSIEHRAVVNSAKERLSVATFYNPGFDAEVGPARGLINDHNPPLFRTVNSLDYFRGLFNQELDGKSYLDVLRLQSDK